MASFRSIAGAVLIAILPLIAQAGNNNHVAKQAAKGAIVGAAIAEVTGGDASQGAAAGAAVGAVSGAIQRNDAEDRLENRSNTTGGQLRRKPKK